MKMGNWLTKTWTNKSEQKGTKDRDIQVQIRPLYILGTKYNQNTNYLYNVSEFLRKHKSDESGDNSIAKTNEFVQILDEKVHVSASDPRYSHIYQGIDTIVQRLVKELGKLDPFIQTYETAQNRKYFLQCEGGFTSRSGLYVNPTSE